MRPFSILVGFAVAIVPIHGGAAVAAGKPDSEAKERPVCRGIVMTGTRTERRVCKKKSEWRAIEEHGSQLVRDVQSRPVINCTQPSGSAC